LTVQFGSQDIDMKYANQKGNELEFTTLTQNLAKILQYTCPEPRPYPIAWLTSSDNKSILVSTYTLCAFSASHLLSELYFDIIKKFGNLVIYDAIKLRRSFLLCSE